MARDVQTTPAFDRLFKRLPRQVQRQALQRLAMYLADPTHRSLRAKRVRGTERIWEMSVTMHYRITFELDGEKIILRRIGTHDILNGP